MLVHSEGVEGARGAHHLVGDHENSLEGEAALAKGEQVLEARAEAF